MEWKEIKITNGKYSISDTGLVRRNNSIKQDKYKRKRIVLQKIIKPCLVGSGYLSVSLRVNLKTVKKYVHQLVAIEFLENPHSFTEVNHKDKIKTNNCVENLEWCSERQNITHSLNLINPGISKTKNGRYRVRIMINGIRYCLGTFNTIIEANNEYRKRLSQV